MKKKYSLLLIFQLLILSAHSQTPILQGNIKMDKKWHNMVYLLKMDKANNFYRGGIPNVLLDSAQVGEDGNFKFNNTKFTDTLSFYRLNIQLFKNKKFPTRSEKFNSLFVLLNKKSNITVNVPNADSLKVNYTLSVSDKYNDDIKKMSLLNTNELKKIAEISQDIYQIYFACTTMHFQWSLRKVNEFDYYQKIYNRLKLWDPKNKYAIDFKQKLDENRNFLKIGDTAPEIILPDINSKITRLSAYKNNYILLDFWYAACQPCREFNKNVLSKLYPQYKSKNFEIIAVSIDKSKESWKKAIEKDNANWIQLINTKGKGLIGIEKYNILNYPSNFLMDKKGKIIKIDVDEKELETFLRNL